MAVEMDFLDRKVKAQMKSADRLQAKYVVVIGDTELETGKVALKNLSTGTQTELTFEEIVENVEQLKLSWQEELA
jgi:histidyl-tRNA synthetase